jgi:hypothetical protein
LYRYISGPPAASRWVMQYLGLTDLNYTSPGLAEDEGYAQFKEEEAAREAAGGGLGKEYPKDAWTDKLGALLALTEGTDDGKGKEEKKSGFGFDGFKLPGSL